MIVGVCQVYEQAMAARDLLKTEREKAKARRNGRKRYHPRALPMERDTAVLGYAPRVVEGEESQAERGRESRNDGD